MLVLVLVFLGSTFSVQAGLWLLASGYWLSIGQNAMHMALKTPRPMSFFIF
jgi:hypothetical protein